MAPDHLLGCLANLGQNPIVALGRRGRNFDAGPGLHAPYGHVPTGHVPTANAHAMPTATARVMEESAAVELVPMANLQKAQLMEEL